MSRQSRDRHCHAEHKSATRGFCSRGPLARAPTPRQRPKQRIRGTSSPAMFGSCEWDSTCAEAHTSSVPEQSIGCARRSFQAPRCPRAARATGHGKEGPTGGPRRLTLRIPENPACHAIRRDRLASGILCDSLCRSIVSLDCGARFAQLFANDENENATAASACIHLHKHRL